MRKLDNINKELYKCVINTININGCYGHFSNVVLGSICPGTLLYKYGKQPLSFVYELFRVLMSCVVLARLCLQRSFHKAHNGTRLPHDTTCLVWSFFLEQVFPQTQAKFTSSIEYNSAFRLYSQNNEEVAYSPYLNTRFFISISKIWLWLGMLFLDFETQTMHK